MARINGITRITKGCSLNCKPYYSNSYNDTVAQSCCETNLCNNERVLVNQPLRCYSCVGCAENYKGIVWDCPLSPEYSCSVRIWLSNFYKLFLNSFSGSSLELRKVKTIGTHICCKFSQWWCFFYKLCFLYQVIVVSTSTLEPPMVCWK